jgi:hypothetical protein
VGLGSASAWGINGTSMTAVPIETTAANLDDSGESIDGVPQRPHFHQVRCSTGENKDAKHHKYPVERKVFSFANEKDQKQRNCVIGQRYEPVRSCVQPDATKSRSRAA